MADQPTRRRSTARKSEQPAHAPEAPASEPAARPILSLDAEARREPKPQDEPAREELARKEPPRREEFRREEPRREEPRREEPRREEPGARKEGPALRINELRSLSADALAERAEKLGIENAHTTRRGRLTQKVIERELEKGSFIFASGVFEAAGNGEFGFLRDPMSNFAPGDDDIYIPAALIRRNNLRTGDEIEIEVRSKNDAGSHPSHGKNAKREDRLAAGRLVSLHGKPPEASRNIPQFEDLTPLHPNRMMRLERPIKAEENITGRLVDLISPIGFGQRALLVAPPKSGKTVMMQHVAHAISANHPDVHLIVLLVDERPEEVTEMIRSVKGEVFSSTFDQPAASHVELAEMVIERAKRLFGAAFANVQPNSGSQMNQAVFFALLQPGDAFMGLDLAAGGHLTHGSPVNMSGKWFRPVPYGVSRDTGRIDMDEVARIAREARPKLIIAGGTAYSRTWDWAAFRQIADEIGAYLMVDMAHIAGLVAGGVHPNPVPHAHVVTTTTHKSLRGPRGGMLLWNDDALTKPLNMAVFPGLQGGPLMHVIAAKAVAFEEALQPEFASYARAVVDNARALAAALQAEGLDIVSGGTDNHSMLVDLRPKQATGKHAEKALDRAAITCNKNAIPFDPEKPFVTSGIRLGTPAGTTRGFGVAEFRAIGGLIAEVVDGLRKNGEAGDGQVEASVRGRVEDLCAGFPIDPEM